MCTDKVFLWLNECTSSSSLLTVRICEVLTFTQSVFNRAIPNHYICARCVPAHSSSIYAYYLAL